MQMDHLDEIAAKVLGGYLVRKDLVRRFSKQFPVPTYVVEFLLGRYCASTDEEEIKEGLELVQKNLADKAVSGGNEELFKSRARENGTVKIIDIITARLDAANDTYVATLPSLQLERIRISSDLVREHERMLTGGFYAEVTLAYDPAMSQEHKNPFGIDAIREIQLSQCDVLETLCNARKAFTTEEWKDFLLRCAGYEPTALTTRQKDALLLRMVPLVERNYNLVELGPRGTGKSHLYQQISPYAHLVSGGKASIAKMFVNNSNGQRGLVCHYDTICFDEVSGISFDKKEGVNIMKGYMEAGEFSRGKESIRADGCIVMVGNFDVDMEHQQKLGHLLAPLPPEMRDDTAFMDRIHSYVPGWDVPKFDPKVNLTNHFGLVSDYISECWHQLRMGSRVSEMQGRVSFGSALSGRDSGAVNKTVSGLLKLISPDPEAEVSDADLEWAVRLAMESRLRVKEQQKYIGPDEFRRTDFSYIFEGAEERFVATPEGRSSNLPATAAQAAPVAEVVEPVPTVVVPAPAPQEANTAASGANDEPVQASVADEGPQPGMKSILEGESGIDYDSLFGEYIRGATKILIVDPYIRTFHQARNLMEFLETVLRFREKGVAVRVQLQTSADDMSPQSQEGYLTQIQQSVAEAGINFTYAFADNLHDRIIEADTGWKIVLGRGLDIFQYHDAKNAFLLSTRLQSHRTCKAFSITYVKV